MQDTGAILMVVTLVPLLVLAVLFMGRLIYMGIKDVVKDTISRKTKKQLAWEAFILAWVLTFTAGACLYCLGELTRGLH